MRELLRHPTGAAGVLLLTIIAVMTIAGPWLAPFDPQQFNPLARLQGPSAQYWLGTDQFGRDILSRILNGARSTILFGLSATILGVLAGGFIGLVAGAIGGVVGVYGGTSGLPFVVPWLNIAVALVGVPLLTALGAMALTRSEVRTNRRMT